MTDKDRKMNELVNRLMEALCRHDLNDRHVSQAEDICEEIYQLGYDLGYEEGREVGVRDINVGRIDLGYV